MARSMACSGSGVAHQVISALACGSVTALPLSVSRSSLRAFARFRNARPADWLAGDFVKNSGRRGSGASVWENASLENRQQVLLSALRSGADEDELADQPSVLGRDLLGDEAAEGKAQQVDFGEAEQVDEGDRVRAIAAILSGV